MKDKWKTLVHAGAVCRSYKKTYMRIIWTTRWPNSYRSESQIPSWGWQVHVPPTWVWGVYLPVKQQEDQSRLTIGWMQPTSFQFLASQIADTIYRKYFDGKRIQGMLDPEFIKCVNSTLVYLTYAILCHHLGALRVRIFQDPPHFNPDGVAGMNPGVPTSWLLL